MSRAKLRLSVSLIAAASACSAPKPASTAASKFDTATPGRAGPALAVAPRSTTPMADMMATASIWETPLRAYDRDTLQWVASADSCVMMVHSFGPTAGAPGVGGDYYKVAEAGVTIGPGAGPDAASSPDWKKLAYVSTWKLPADTTKWSPIEGQKLSVADIRRVAEERPDGSRWISVVIVEGADSTRCSGGGEECPVPMVSPIYGGRRVAWSTDSRVLFVRDPVDTTRWNAINPWTRKPTSDSGTTRYEVPWATRAVASAIETPFTGTMTGGSTRYRFTVRGDSIIVIGPDGLGGTGERVLGTGVPIAVTRNGQFLLAVRHEKGRVRAVIYNFRMHQWYPPSVCSSPPPG